MLGWIAGETRQSEATARIIEGQIDREYADHMLSNVFMGVAKKLAE
jgi:hypothetical protein